MYIRDASCCTISTCVGIDNSTDSNHCFIEQIKLHTHVYEMCECVTHVNFTPKKSVLKILFTKSSESTLTRAEKQSWEDESRS